MSRWYLRGKHVEQLDADDRAIQYGDGLFETIAIRDGQPRLWAYHVERLQTGCAKLIVSAGPGPRGYRRVESSTTLLIGICERRKLPQSIYQDGIAVRLCNTRLAIQPQLAGMKTLNRLEQVLARNEWSDETVFEGLTLDTDGRLICGTMSNVFLLYDNQLVTPSITRCGVSGVMRRHVLTVAQEAGVSCDVRDVDADDLHRCDGLMLSNSQFGLLPVKSCDQILFESSPTADQMMKLIRDSGIREVAI